MDRERILQEVKEMVEKPYADMTKQEIEILNKHASELFKKYNIKWTELGYDLNDDEK